MIDLTEQVALQPSDKPREKVRFVKLKPSQRPGLANSALSSTFAPNPCNSGRLSRPPLKRPFKTSAPTWRADQSSSGDSSDESSDDSDDDDDSGRRKKHDTRGGVRANRRPATRNMLQVRRPTSVCSPHLSSLMLEGCRRWPMRWTPILCSGNTERCRQRNKAVCRNL